MPKKKQSTEAVAALVILKPLALTWARAQKAQWDFDEKARAHREGTKAKQRQDERLLKLDTATCEAQDELMKAASGLPFRLADEDPMIKTLITIMSVGLIADMGYDRDSMFEWVGELEENLVNTLLEDNP